MIPEHRDPFRGFDESFQEWLEREAQYVVKPSRCPSCRQPHPADAPCKPLEREDNGFTIEPRHWPQIT